MNDGTSIYRRTYPTTILKDKLFMLWMSVCLSDMDLSNECKEVLKML